MSFRYVLFADGKRIDVLRKKFPDNFFSMSRGFMLFNSKTVPDLPEPVFYLLSTEHPYFTMLHELEDTDEIN